jgi:NAD(P)H dehydrogenase (quinone)
MNILIVTAHPSSKGDTHTIANTYAEAKRSKGHVVEIVDLYKKEYAVDLFAFENIREFQKSKVQLKFREQIQWAHEIVMVHPVWWSSPPAIMKNWVDLTIWPGVAYKYTPEGKVLKLLEGKAVKVFATSGGPSWYFHFPFVLPLRTFWETCVFGFSGADLTCIKVCGNMDKWKDEKRAKHLAKFIESIRKEGLR